VKITEQLCQKPWIHNRDWWGDGRSTAASERFADAESHGHVQTVQS
jgi:hypothetical protein